MHAKLGGIFLEVFSPVMSQPSSPRFPFPSGLTDGEISPGWRLGLLFPEQC